MGSTDGIRSPRTPVPSRHEQAGTVLAGKYRVERVLGRGGMGLVVACRHLRLRQTVALKLLLPSAGRPEITTRLLREARSAAALRSDRVARVYDVDTLEDGTGYIVMEYLEGKTLADLLEEKGRLDPQRTVDYALQACEALAEAHELGIVHRDLKPSNLFLAKRGAQPSALCVLDFGISKAFDRPSDESTTDTHGFIGSPPYASPEQLVRPRAVDERTDIWSLGVVLFECLSNERPFQGETLTSLWNSILRDDVPALPSDAKLDPALEAAVRRCLEKSPDDRFPNVLELAHSLVSHGSSRAQASLEAIEAIGVRSARPSSDSPGLISNDADTTLTEAPIVQDFGKEKALRRRWLNGLLVAASAAAVLVALSWARGRQAQEPNVRNTSPAGATTVAPPISSAGVAASERRAEVASPSPAQAETGARDTALPPKVLAVANPKVLPRANPKGAPRLDASASPSVVRVGDDARPVSATSPAEPAPPAAPRASGAEITEDDVYSDRE